MSFRKAKAAKIGGKFLVYGESGSGKSTFQLTFPRVACVDSEAGVAHYEGKDISILENNSLDEYNNPSRTQEINENRGIVDRKLILNYLKSINEINGKEILKEIAEEEVKAKQKIKDMEKEIYVKLIDEKISKYKRRKEIC